MSNDSLDRRAASARADLRSALDPEPPDLNQIARRAANRHRAVAVTGVLLLVVATAVAFASRTDDSGSDIVAGPSESGTNEDLLAPGESRPMSPSPLAGRSTMASVWTGSEMLIWGGDSPSGQLGDGAAYDPRADTWELLPDAPLAPRNAPAAVWTGDEMLLWGGSASGGDSDDGAAYNPETRAWRTISPAPFSSAGRPVGLWTGSEMIVLAGFNSSDVAAYDPAADRWRVLPNTPSNLQAPNPVATWTGDSVVAVVQPEGPMASPSVVVSMSISDERWIEAPSVGSGQVVLAWTGETVVAAAGDEALLLDLDSNRWTPIAAAPDDSAVGDTPAVWTGSQLFLWEGDRASLVDPTEGSWRSTPAGDAGRRTQPAVAWADGVLIAWGGFADEASGVIVRPQGGDSSSVVLTPVDETGEVPGRVPVPEGFVDTGSSVGSRTYVADPALARAAAEEQRRGRELPSTSETPEDPGPDDDRSAQERAEQSAVTVAEATIYLEHEGGSPSSITVTVTEGDVYSPGLLAVLLDFDPSASAVTIRGRSGALRSDPETGTTSVAWQERDGLSVYVAVIGADARWVLDYVEHIEL